MPWRILHGRAAHVNNSVLGDFLGENKFMKMLFPALLLGSAIAFAAGMASAQEAQTATENPFGQGAQPATSKIVSFDRRFQVPLYYLHGKLFGPEKPSIIITESDYAEFRKKRQMMFEVLKLEFATSTFLYIGY